MLVLGQCISAFQKAEIVVPGLAGFVNAVLLQPNSALMRYRYIYIYVNAAAPMCKPETPH